MTKLQRKIIIGQILGDAHIEKIKTNCRMSFSFGTSFQEYALWIYSLFTPFCSNSIYSVLVKANEKSYTNYRLKTRTIEVFNEFHNLFYKYDPAKEKYRKVIPELIRSEMCEIVLAHFIMGDGNYGQDGRVRIYTNNYTLEECILLRDSIQENCDVKCEVLFDRVGKDKKDQYILTIGKIELKKLQSLVKPYMHSSMLYRVGLNKTSPS